MSKKKEVKETLPQVLEEGVKLFEEKDVIRAIQESEGEIPEWVQKEFDEIALKQKSKIDGVGFHYLMKQKELEGLKEFKNSIDARMKSLRNSIQRFEEYLAPLVRHFGEENDSGYKWLVGNIVKIKDISSNINLYDENDVPAEYKTATITIPYNSYLKIKKALESVLIREEISIDKKAVDTDIATIGMKYEPKLINKVSFLNTKKLEVKEEPTITNQEK